MVYTCNVCNKEYKSYQSCWNHNKRFHRNEINKNQNEFKNIQENIKNNKSNTTIHTENTEQHTSSQPKKYQCRYCPKSYSIAQSRWYHENDCKEKKNKETEYAINTEKQEIEQKLLQLQLKKEEARTQQEEFRTLKLKLQLQNAEKNSEENSGENCTEMMSSHTIRNLNKLLAKNRHNINKDQNKDINNTMNQSNNNGHSNNNSYNNTTNSHNTTNNTNVQNNIVNNNNIQIFGFGKEEGVLETLGKDEQLTILNSCYKCLKSLIDTMYCGKYNQYKNLLVTNMKDKYMHVFDDEKCTLKTANKDDVMNTLIDNRMDDICEMMEEFSEKRKINNKTNTRLKDYMDKMSNGDNKYKKQQIEDITLLLFNNREKIANDIADMLCNAPEQSKDKE